MRAAAFACSERLATLSAREASIRPMPSSRSAARKPLSLGWVPPEGGSTCATSSFFAFRRTHSATCSSRSSADSSARCRFSAISQSRASISSQSRSIAGMRSNSSHDQFPSQRRTERDRLNFALIEFAAPWRELPPDLAGTNRAPISLSARHPRMPACSPVGCVAADVPAAPDRRAKPVFRRWPESESPDHVSEARRHRAAGFSFRWMGSPPMPA